MDKAPFPLLPEFKGDCSTILLRLTPGKSLKDATTRPASRGRDALGPGAVRPAERIHGHERLRLSALGAPRPREPILPWPGLVRLRRERTRAHRRSALCRLRPGHGGAHRPV